MRRLFSSIVLLFLLPAAAAQNYSATKIDANGRLHIVLGNGMQVAAPLLKHQVSFAAAAVSPDHRTIGWLALYPDPLVGVHASPLAGTLVFFREGHILRRFTTDQVFWDWAFANSHRVAYSTGPTHGGAAECVLRDIDTGAVLSQWTVDQAGSPPEWARALRR